MGDERAAVGIQRRALLEQRAGLWRWGFDERTELLEAVDHMVECGHTVLVRNLTVTSAEASQQGASRADLPRQPDRMAGAALRARARTDGRVLPARSHDGRRAVRHYLPGHTGQSG